MKPELRETGTGLRYLPTAVRIGALVLLLSGGGPLPRGAWAEDLPGEKPRPAAPASLNAANITAAESLLAPYRPSILSSLPFVAILLSIAFLPLIHRTEHWWHSNRNKLILALALGAVTLVYYGLRGHGVGHGEHASAAGLGTVGRVLQHAVLDEYVPFIILLFSLYTISGGIQLKGDLRATPLTNTAFLAVGAVAASFIGTTGASMLLIRPLLQTNSERKHVRHTVIFFIFLVSNIGGCLLPTGDPPLFLGYLYGVPFLWTLRLWVEWVFCVVILLVVYFIWDTRAFRKEDVVDIRRDTVQIEPLRVRGLLNLVWLLGVVLSVGLLVPGQPFLGRFFTVPVYLREMVLLAFVGLAWWTTSATIRKENDFNFSAIIEVAALFIGIFITMQAPIEILRASGDSLRQVVKGPAYFFWMTGALSSFLDNAPTYVVFLEMARSMTSALGDSVQAGVLRLGEGAPVVEAWLVAVSLGAVFMGANTYIGNGPNFMVKSIAEQSGVKMPSFLGYMAYSILILIPLFLLVTVVFFLGC